MARPGQMGAIFSGHPPPSWRGWGHAGGALWAPQAGMGGTVAFGIQRGDGTFMGWL